MQPLTPRLELSRIRRLWDSLSPILVDILKDPHIELRQSRAIRRPRPGERFTPDVVRRFTQRGLHPRDAVRDGVPVELPTAIPDRNTRENGAIVAFMGPYWAAGRPQPEVRSGRTRHAKIRGVGTDDPALARFFQQREEPKIARLEEIVDAREGALTELRRAMRSFAVPVSRMGRQNLLASFNGP